MFCEEDHPCSKPAMKSLCIVATSTRKIQYDTIILDVNKEWPNAPMQNVSELFAHIDGNDNLSDKL